MMKQLLWGEIPGREFDVVVEHFKWAYINFIHKAWYRRHLSEDTLMSFIEHVKDNSLTRALLLSNLFIFTFIDEWIRTSFETLVTAYVFTFKGNVVQIRRKHYPEHILPHHHVLFRERAGLYCHHVSITLVSNACKADIFGAWILTYTKPFTGNYA